MRTIGEQDANILRRQLSAESCESTINLLREQPSECERSRTYGLFLTERNRTKADFRAFLNPVNGPKPPSVRFPGSGFQPLAFRIQPFSSRVASRIQSYGISRSGGRACSPLRAA